MPEQQVEQPQNWLEEAAKQPENAETPVEPQVEETEESEPAPQAKEKVEKVVPLAALHEERAKRREAIAREQATAQQLEQMRRQQIEWLARQQPQPQAPDPATDPVGALMQGQQKTAQELQALRQQQLQDQQTAFQRQQVESFVATVRAQN